MKLWTRSIADGRGLEIRSVSGPMPREPLGLIPLAVREACDAMSINPIPLGPLPPGTVVMVRKGYPLPSPEQLQGFASAANGETWYPGGGPDWHNVERTVREADERAKAEHPWLSWKWIGGKAGW